MHCSLEDIETYTESPCVCPKGTQTEKCPLSNIETQIEVTCVSSMETQMEFPTTNASFQTNSEEST